MTTKVLTSLPALDEELDKLIQSIASDGGNVTRETFRELRELRDRTRACLSGVSSTIETLVLCAWCGVLGERLVATVAMRSSRGPEYIDGTSQLVADSELFAALHRPEVLRALYDTARHLVAIEGDLSEEDVASLQALMRAVKHESEGRTSQSTNESDERPVDEVLREAIAAGWVARGGEC